MGVQTLPESEIRVYSGAAIARDEELAFRLTGNPYSSQDGSLLTGENQRWFVIGFGILGAGLVVSGIWIYYRNQKRNLKPDQVETSSLDRDQILDSIIALEELYQAGEISESAFQRKREQLKEELRDISGNE
jgi:hypothetical protein